MQEVLQLHGAMKLGIHSEHNKDHVGQAIQLGAHAVRQGTDRLHPLPNAEMGVGGDAAKPYDTSVYGKTRNQQRERGKTKGKGVFGIM